MFEITYADPELEKKVKNSEKYYPPEVCRELDFFLNTLRKDGQLSKTDFYDINTQRVSLSTLYLFYRPNIVRSNDIFTKKEILIIDIHSKPADVLRQRFTVVDDWDDKNVIPSIPQYDQPKKIIKSIELISQGITESYELGYELGHRGKKREYITRHGQYAKHTLEQLNLISRERQGRKLLSRLTDKGCLIANALNAELKFRLLSEAMLNYSPIWKVIEAVTNMEGELGEEKVLSEALIKNLVFPEVLRDSDTSNRRSITLKNWIKWISKREGIPIRLHDEGIQLSIPMINTEK